MPKKRLTEEGVAKLKPPAKGKQLDYFDAGMPGLVLRVNYGGAKVWRALYYIKKLDQDGKRVTVPTTHKLGRYPHLTLKKAREKARQFLADPQKALAQADIGSFKEVAQNFIKRHVDANRLRSKPEIERCLTKYIYPAWEHRPFLELKRGDVAALLDRIEDDHGPRQADLCLAIISKMTHWYQARSDDYVSPVVRGMRRAKAADRKRKRILDDDEIRALWKACDAMGLDDAGKDNIAGRTFGDLVKVLLLTGQRREKVATMRWSDLVDGEWRIATEAGEKPNAGSLKLPQAVLDIIPSRPRAVGNPYVFFGAPRGRRRGSQKRSEPPAFNSFSQQKAELDKKLPKGTPHWTLHDLRRTARSLMARAGVRPDIAERVLGHAIPGVEGVYDRHTYSAEKADALSKLDALVGKILNPPEGNVVALRPA
jgi:integrase